MAKAKGELITVVREWDNHHPDSLAKIHATIDSWGRRPDEPTPRDRADIAAAVDRVTKRVKTRKVTVHETVTEFVDEDVPVEFLENNGSQTAQAVEAPKSSGKRKPKILGWFGPKGGKKKVDDAVAKRSERNAAEGATEGGQARDDYKPQCSALTEDGAQCRNSARGESKYCASHKGWQPPTAKGLAQRIEGDAWDPSDKVTDHSSVRSADTRPVVRKAKDTKVSVRKATKKSGRKKR